MEISAAFMPTKLENEETRIMLLIPIHHPSEQPAHSALMGVGILLTPHSKNLGSYSIGLPELDWVVPTPTVFVYLFICFSTDFDPLLTINFSIFRMGTSSKFDLMSKILRAMIVLYKTS